MLDPFDNAEDYIKTKNRVWVLISSAEEPLTIRQLKQHFANDAYLWDALEALEVAGWIENVGSLMICKWQCKKQAIEDNKSKVCAGCQQEKPLIEFYQEWSGSPAKKCKQCKIASAKKRGRKKAEDKVSSEGEELDTFEV